MSVSVNIKVSFRGHETFRDRLDLLIREYPDLVDKLLEQIAEDTKNDAKSIAPRKTGNLIAGIIAEKMAFLKYRVTSTAGYSGFVEHGHSSWKGQPFMGPAISKNSLVIREEMIRLLRLQDSSYKM